MSSTVSLCPNSETVVQPLLNAQFYLSRNGFELDVNLIINIPGVTAIFGPSGCGKTTLLRCLAGLETECKGTLFIEGANALSLAPSKRLIGYVPQDAYLFEHLTAKENIDFSRKRSAQPISDTELRELIRILDIAEILNRKPGQLSGGEKQRVAMARALSIKPKMLILDEPLASIDASRKSHILNYFEQLFPRLAIPIVFVTHSLQEITRLADNVVVMEAGRVSVQGAVMDLLAKPYSYKYFSEQPFSVLSGKVTTVSDHYNLTEIRVGELIFKMPKQEVELGQIVRLRVSGRDVSLALVEPQQSSILNVFFCRINDINMETGVGSCLVSLVTEGGVTLMAQVSSYSQSKLNLSIGLSVFVQVKAVSIVH